MTLGRRIVGGALVLALLGLGPATAQAELLDANCSVPTNAGSSGTEAQTFTAVHTGTLVRGEMFVAKTAGADFQMQILNAGPSGPIGGPLATQNIPDSSVDNVASPSPTSPSAPVDGTFSPGVSVTAGKQYAILVTRSAGSFVAKDNDTHPCPGNEFAGSVGGTWTLANPNYDFPFATYVNPTNTFTVGKLKGTKLSVAVPGPGSLTLAQQPLAPGEGAAIRDFKVLRRSTAHASAAGTLKVRVRINKTGRSLLRHLGKFKRIVQVTYMPDGGTAAAQTLKLKLRR